MIERLTRIIRESEVDQFCGLRRTQRAELVRLGLFPKPVKLSSRAVGYLESELVAWLNDRLAERDKTAGRQR